MMAATEPSIDKAVVLVVRRGPTGARDLLVFHHPSAGVQVPKGTVEAGEDIAAAALRELHEESGLILAGEPKLIGRWDRVTDAGRLHRWHFHLFEAPPGLPAEWSHVAMGSAEEDGLIFAFRWLAVDGALAEALDPLFGECARVLLAHLGLGAAR